MLGNGVKRKLDEDEDGLGVEGGLLSPGLAGGVSRPSYSLQRQTILNMSLMKLYGPRTPAEPRLQRRVLIGNVIRRIHQEVKEEGGLRTFFFPIPPSVAGTPSAGEDEGYCHQSAPMLPAPAASLGLLSPSPLTGLSGLDSCLTPASLLEEDPPLFFALPPTSSSPHPLHQSPRPLLLPSHPPKDSFSSALEEIEDLCPTTDIVVASSATAATLLSTFSSPSCPSSLPSAAQALMSDVNMKEEVSDLLGESREEKPIEPPPPSHSSPPRATDMSSSPGAFLTDFALDDVLFTDIDTSMYDLGPCSSPTGVTAAKIAPVVMATDDLVRTISTYGGTGINAPSQPFKMDLAELDHIMEVLVGS